VGDRSSKGLGRSIPLARGTVRFATGGGSQREELGSGVADNAVSVPRFVNCGRAALQGFPGLAVSCLFQDRELAEEWSKIRGLSRISKGQSAACAALRFVGNRPNPTALDALGLCHPNSLRSSMSRASPILARALIQRVHLDSARKPLLPRRGLGVKYGDGARLLHRGSKIVPSRSRTVRWRADRCVPHR
jgi:hypothetical protein